MAEPVEPEPHDGGRRMVLGVAGALMILGASLLVDDGKNAAFATAMALAGTVCVVLALIPDRLDVVSAGSVRAKVRNPRRRATDLDEIAAEKGSGAEVTVAEDELPTASGFLATLRVLDAWLHPADGPLGGCELHVYTFDESDGVLVPLYEPDPDRLPSSWLPGIGVTGQAYLTDSFVLATGEQTHNETFGLPVEEQGKHVDLLEVAALPITNAAGHTIAVLAISNRVRPDILSSAEGYEEALALAEALARVLVDLLGGFEDT